MNDNKKFIALLIILLVCSAVSYLSFQNITDIKRKQARTKENSVTKTLFKSEMKGQKKAKNIFLSLKDSKDNSTEEAAAKEIDVAKDYLADNLESYYKDEDTYMQLIYYSNFLQYFGSFSDSKNNIEGNSIVSSGVNIHSFLVDLYPNKFKAVPSNKQQKKILQLLRSIDNDTEHDINELIKMLEDTTYTYIEYDDSEPGGSSGTSTSDSKS